MKTKAFLPLALSAFLTLVTLACNKEDASPVSPEKTAETPQEVTVRLSVVPDTPPTRVTVEDTEDEAKVTAVEFLVFKQDTGNGAYVIDAFKRVTGTTTTDLTMTQGFRRIYAIVNPTETYEDISTFNDLLMRATQLKDQAPDFFTMVGNVDQTVNNSTSSISLRVNRMVSRIKIHKITNALTNSTLAAKTFTVNRLFLRRAIGECYPQNVDTYYTQYAVSGVGDHLSKSRGTVDATTEKPHINALIYKDFDMAPTVASGASYTTPHSFYSFPLFGSNDYMSLIVEIKIDNLYYTYPVELAFPLSRNKSYEISELRITRPGNPSNGDDFLSEDEITPIEFATVDEVLVNVQDWNLNLLGTEGTVEF